MKDMYLNQMKELIEELIMFLPVNNKVVEKATDLLDDYEAWSSAVFEASKKASSSESL